MQKHKSVVKYLNEGDLHTIIEVVGKADKAVPRTKVGNNRVKH
jgi:hypothetical protein